MSDKNKATLLQRKTMVLIATFSLSIITIVTPFLPTVNSSYEVPIMLIPILFTITRIMAGFFIGGIWPLGGVIAMEEIKKIRTYKDKDAIRDKTFSSIARYTVQSSFVQVGFQAAVFSVALFLFLDGTNNFSYDLLERWQLMYVVGGLASIVYSILLGIHVYSIKKESKKEDFKKEDDSIQFGFHIIKNEFVHKESFRDRFIWIWLITTGLMYMYYSTTAMIPSLLARIPFETDYFQNDDPLILSVSSFFLAGISLIGHVWLGLVCAGWNSRSLKKKTTESNGTDSHNNEPNTDIKALQVVGAFSMIMAIIVFIAFSYWFSQNSNDFPIILTGTVVALLIFFANAGWGIMPSMLSSMFPRRSRGTGVNLAYNGGVLIGFASPFISANIIFLLGVPVMIFIPICFGAIAMFYGAYKLSELKHRPILDET